jgi:hypothetical protein
MDDIESQVTVSDGSTLFYDTEIDEPKKDTKMLKFKLAEQGRGRPSTSRAVPSVVNA